MEHIKKLPHEVMEQVLLKSFISKNVLVYKMKCKAEQFVYADLSSVCSTWRIVLTKRPWFCKTLQAQLDIKRAYPYLGLRGYQKELAEEAIKGNNTLIVAPTGSGKTHVALYISQDHLDHAVMNEPDRKIAFVVPTIALVSQQCSRYQQYMRVGIKCDGLSGEETVKLPLDTLYDRNDVIIMTPQILVNALEERMIDSLGAFSLIILDECHHTMKDHPYNLVMSRYVDELLTNPHANLPQIVGLTASPGVGKAINMEKAQNHIKKLCANMAAHCVCHVKNVANLAELEKCTNKPVEETSEVSGRTVDPFYKEICQIMEAIEKHMINQDLTKVLTEVPDMKKILLSRPAHGSDPYTQYVSRIRKANAPVRDPVVRRIFIACLRHLEIYNCTLFLNADCRTSDALAYLRNSIDAVAFLNNELSQFNKLNDTDFWLLELFNSREKELARISISPEAKNPKLDSLKNAILESYRTIPESQGIVFCKTREMTEALVNWMKADPELEFLNPTHLVGIQKSGEGAFTRAKLEDALKEFKGGSHKLIVATSVAEEGLDVKQCNYVIRYEHVTNDIARVQARGRARADEAVSRLISDSSRGNVERDEANKGREIMMMRVIEYLESLPQGVLSRSIKELQYQSKIERESVAQANIIRKMEKQAREHKDEYELRCIKCEAFGVWSQDLRTIKQTHHVLVGDNGFENRISMVPHPRPKKYDGWEKKAKVICKECSQEWGIKALCSNIPYFVLAVCNFIIIDPNGDRKVVKKWKDVVFPVPELSLDDLKNMNQSS